MDIMNRKKHKRLLWSKGNMQINQFSCNLDSNMSIEYTLLGSK